MAGAFSHVSIIDINEILSVPIIDVHGGGRASLASSFVLPHLSYTNLSFPVTSVTFLASQMHLGFQFGSLGCDLFT